AGRTAPRAGRGRKPEGRTVGAIHDGFQIIEPQPRADLSGEIIEIARAQNGCMRVSRALIGLKRRVLSRRICARVSALAGGVDVGFDEALGGVVELAS